MFWETTDYTFLMKAEEKLKPELRLPSHVRIPIDLYDPEKPWTLYNITEQITYQKNGRFTESKVIDIATPKFTNLRWMLKTRDYPDGELGALLTFGLLRGKETSVILVGDWMNQMFNLSRFVEKIPEFLKHHNTNIHCYNSKDLTFIDNLYKK